jgi:hypothetical protein
MRLLNERHLDEIIDGIVSYNVLLEENKAKNYFACRQIRWLPFNKSFHVRKANIF